jgi:hypothetical protein
MTYIDAAPTGAVRLSRSTTTTLSDIKIQNKTKKGKAAQALCPTTSMGFYITVELHPPNSHRWLPQRAHPSSGGHPQETSLPSGSSLFRPAE